MFGTFQGHQEPRVTSTERSESEPFTTNISSITVGKSLLEYESTRHNVKCPGRQLETYFFRMKGLTDSGLLPATNTNNNEKLLESIYQMQCLKSNSNMLTNRRF